MSLHGQWVSWAKEDFSLYSLTQCFLAGGRVDRQMDDWRCSKKSLWTSKLGGKDHLRTSGFFDGHPLVTLKLSPRKFTSVFCTLPWEVSTVRLMQNAKADLNLRLPERTPRQQTGWICLKSRPCLSARLKVGSDLLRQGNVRKPWRCSSARLGNPLRLARGEVC